MRVLKQASPLLDAFYFTLSRVKWGEKGFRLGHHAAISLGTKIVSIEGKSTKPLLKWVVNTTLILGCNPHKPKALWTIKLLWGFPLGSLPQLVSGCSWQQADWVMFSEHLSPAMYNNLNRMWIQKDYYQLCNDQFGPGSTSVWPPLEYVERSLSRPITNMGDKKGHEDLVANSVLPGSAKWVWIHGGDQRVEGDVCMMPKAGDLGKACVSQVLKCVFFLSLSGDYRWPLNNVEVRGSDSSHSQKCFYNLQFHPQDPQFFGIHGCVFADSTKLEAHSAVCIYWKIMHIRLSTQFKPVLFQGSTVLLSPLIYYNKWYSNYWY